MKDGRLKAIILCSKTTILIHKTKNGFQTFGIRFSIKLSRII